MLVNWIRADMDHDDDDNDFGSPGGFEDPVDKAAL
jgi:hypothetical protein